VEAVVLVQVLHVAHHVAALRAVARHVEVVVVALAVDPKRTIRINFSDNDCKDFEISKAASIDTDNTVLSIEKGKDGKFRLIFGKKYIEDFSKVLNITMVRDENIDYNNVIQYLNNKVLNEELEK
jgi:hypothetical protein